MSRPPNVSNVTSWQGDNEHLARASQRCRPPRHAPLVRDEEAAGSNPATPTEKFQLDAMIAKRGDHGVDRLLAVRWRDWTPEPGMSREVPPENATVVRHRLLQVERQAPTLFACRTCSTSPTAARRPFSGSASAVESRSCRSARLAGRPARYHADAGRAPVAAAAGPQRAAHPGTAASVAHQQMKDAARALLKGDPNRWGVIKAYSG